MLTCPGFVWTIKRYKEHTGDLTISFSSPEKLLHKCGNMSGLACSNSDSQLSRCFIRKCAACTTAKSNSKGSPDSPVNLSECISLAVATIALWTIWRKICNCECFFWSGKVAWLEFLSCESSTQTIIRILTNTPEAQNSRSLQKNAASIRALIEAETPSRWLWPLGQAPSCRRSMF